MPRSVCGIIVGLGLLASVALTSAELPDVWQDCPECPMLARIAGGSFTMGTDSGESGREPDEGPTHRITIAGNFALGVYEVTRAQFGAFATVTGFQTEAGCFFMDPKAQKWVDDPALSWRNPGFFQDEAHPVTCVSFSDAQAYVRWLTERSDQPYRLPSEAEWEYAVRAGTTTSRFWGDSPADGCRYANAVDETAREIFAGWKFAPCEDGYIYTSPVGSFAPNAAGLFDMPGNLWEWVEDCWNDSHQNRAFSGAPRSDGDCLRRVIRGGAWDDEHEDLRSGNRLSVPAERRYNTIGIRVVRDL